MKDKRATILKAASILLLSQDSKALNVRAVAAEAGVSTMGIYSYFENKQGVLDALYVEGFTELRDAMATASRHSDPMEAASEAVSRYLDMALSNLGRYRLMFSNAGPGYQPTEEALAFAQTAFERFAELSARLLSDTASKHDVLSLAAKLWAQLHGFVSLREHLEPRYKSENAWRKMVTESMADLIETSMNRVH